MHTVHVERTGLRRFIGRRMVPGMRLAETVTFGTSGLDRAAHRRRVEAQAELRADPAALGIAMWRGKPLLDPHAESGGHLLVDLPLDHPVLADEPPAAFLGMEGDTPRFAFDLSAWQPDEMPETLGGFSDPSEQIHPLLERGVFSELRTAMTRLSRRDAELAATARGLFEWHRFHRFCARCGVPSHLAAAGWERACPACGARHFPRTDPVVIMLVTHGNSVLMGRSPGWPDGMYSLLAGFVEPGETIEAAVRRETWEEAGIRVGPVTYLSSQPWPFPASLMIGCRADAVSTEIRRDPEEIEDARWMPREEVLAALAGEHPDVLPARHGAIAHFLLTNWLADRLD